MSGDTMVLLTTREASVYCKSRGRTVSVGSLRRYRLRAPDDPGEKGPDFVRDDQGLCLYPCQSLESWIAAWRAKLRPRAPGTFRGQLNSAA